MNTVVTYLSLMKRMGKISWNFYPNKMERILVMLENDDWEKFKEKLGVIY